MELCSSWAQRSDFPAWPDDVKASAEEQDDALLVASGILFRLTGSRWPGACTDVVRPQRRSCGCSGGRTGCTWVSELELPGVPVIAVSEVLIDGDIVDEDRYRVDDARYLVYLPESDSAERRGWPCCQRNDLDVSQEDTWQVTYTWGGLPDRGGVRAAAELARELVLANYPNSGCRLPQRVQSVSRQGVSYVLLDSLDLFDQGRTGLVGVDLWLSSHRIGQSRRRSAVIDPHDVAMRGRKHRRSDTNPSS